MNKKCTQCGKELLPEWKFCPECGEKIYSMTISELEKSAESGDSESQFQLARKYDKGDEVIANSKEAVKWYKKSAEAGNALAQFNLGCCYLDGEGVEKNCDEAMKWFRKAAEQGFVEAKFNLAFLLLDTVKVKDNVKVYAKKNISEAIKLLKEAAEAGSGYAQNLLGLQYATGDYIEKDNEEAKRLFQAAADQGYADAQNNLGKWYFFEHKYFDAMWWYRKAAEQGHVEAQYNMAVCYFFSLDILTETQMSEVKRLYEIAMSIGAEDESNLKKILEEYKPEDDD